MSHTQSAKEHGESTVEFSMLNIDGADPAKLCGIGAGHPDVQPGAGRWRALVDPDRRLSCLSPRPAATP